MFFEGNHLSIQVPHRRLIGFTLFKDGLQVRIADRRTEPIFRVADPLVVAAIAGGASLKTSNEPLPRVYAVSPSGLAGHPGRFCVIGAFATSVSTR